MCDWWYVFFFFYAQKRMRKLLKSPRESPRRKLTTRPPHTAIGALQKSLSTSETSGASPSVPRLPCTPNNEHAKALAAAQDKIEPHRCYQDWWARARSGFGVGRVLAPAKSLRKVCVSSEKRPPVSPATTTSLARPLPPTSSG